MRTVIHVNMHKVKAKDPQPLAVKTYKSNTPAAEAVIVDKLGNEVARVVYRPDNPLPCGARVWIETEQEVRVA